MAIRKRKQVIQTHNIKILIKYLVLFLLGGYTYYGIEILWRGYSHYSMIICGGICFIYAGLQNEQVEWDYPFWKQVLRVEAFILSAEFITGCIVNLWLGLDVWDYSGLPGNILGQTCPQFALLFLPLSAIAIIVDKYKDIVIYSGEFTTLFFIACKLVRRYYT